MSQKCTIKVLADQLDVDYPVAAGLVKLLVAKGIATVSGKQPAASASGKGKPSTIYEIPDQFTLSLLPDGQKKAKPASTPEPEPVAETVEQPADAEFRTAPVETKAA